MIPYHQSCKDRLRSFFGSVGDSLLAAGVAGRYRGAVFGLHRAADTAGAVAGPLLGLALYEALGHRLRPLFWIAVIPAVAWSAPSATPARPAGGQPRGVRPGVSYRDLPGRYWRVLAVLTCFGLVNFPDALTAGAAACKAGAAVVLTAGSSMPPVSQSYLNNHPGARFAIGGPSAAADPSATAVVGFDRYDTGRKTALRFFSGPTVVGLASGTNFPDAMSGGAHIGKKGGPLLLTDPFTLSGPTDAYLKANAASIATIFVYGGLAAVSNPVAAQAQADIV